MSQRANRTTGAEDRFRVLYAMHYLDVLAYFVRRLPQKDAEDAAAEVFVVVWRRLAEVESMNDPRSWLFGVAHNVLRNSTRKWLRRKRLTTRLAGLATPPPISPEIYVLRSERDQMMLDALRHLSFDERELLRLVAWENLSHAEVAQVLGMREVAVSQRVSRARKKLDKALTRVEGRNSTASRLSTHEGWE